MKRNFKPKTLYAVKNGLFTIIIDDPADQKRQWEAIQYHQKQLNNKSSSASYRLDYKSYSRQRYWQLNQLCDILQLKFCAVNLKIGECHILKPSAPAPHTGIATVKAIYKQCGKSSETWMNFVLLDIELMDQTSIQEHDSSSEKGSQKSISLQFSQDHYENLLEINDLPQKNQNSDLQLAFCLQSSETPNQILEKRQASQIQQDNSQPGHEQSVHCGLLLNEALNQFVEKQGLSAQQKEQAQRLQNQRLNGDESKKFDIGQTKSLGQQNISDVNQEVANPAVLIQENPAILIQENSFYERTEEENFFDGDSEEEIFDEPEVSFYLGLHQVRFDRTDLTASRNKTRKN